MKGYISEMEADRVLNRRASQRIPGHRAPFAHRDQPNSQTLPHAHIRAQYCCRQIKILVLPDEVEEGQEGKWRDH